MILPIRRPDLVNPVERVDTNLRGQDKKKGGGVGV